MGHPIKAREGAFKRARKAMTEKARKNGPGKGPGGNGRGAVTRLQARDGVLRSGRVKGRGRGGSDRHGPGKAGGAGRGTGSGGPTP